MDVVTLTLNPCLDRTLWVGGFEDPPLQEEWQTGGKGVNVARVLGNLGVEALAVCPLGGRMGVRFKERAKAEGVNLLAVPVVGETRVISTRVRAGDHAQRVDYRRGEPLDGRALDHLEDALFSSLEGAKALVISGSASCAEAAERIPGILRRARERGIATVLDSNGEALLRGVRGIPTLLKPNEAELMSLTGSAAPDSAAKLNEMGVEAVLLSMGARGCCLIREGMQKYCPAPKVRAVNPVGSGDSFLAGYLYASLKGYSDELSLMLACAAGAANAAVFPAARVRREELVALMGRDI